MEANNDNKRKLYDALSKEYDFGSYEQFCADIQDDSKRKKLFDATSEEYDFGDYDKFSSQLGFTQTEQTATTPATPTQEEQPWQPTGQDKIRMSHDLDQMMQRTRQNTAAFNEHIDNMREYSEGGGLGQTVKGKKMFNPESGQFEDTYVTPAGNRYNNKGVADLESFRYRQAADMSVGGQLRRAYRKLEDLHKKRFERSQQISREITNEFNGNGGLFSGLSRAKASESLSRDDKQTGAISVAIRETEELIKTLEEQQDRDNGVDVGFWRGFGRDVGIRTWDMGMGALRDASVKVNAENLTGENATDGERAAYDEMMGAIYNNEQAEQLYGGNASFWYTAGVMAGHMPSFMLDFALTGGGYSGINAVWKLAAKGAVKAVGKEVAEDIAKQGVKSYVKNNGIKGFGQVTTNWTIKALGTTADDLLIRAPLMTNTVQMGKTGADIIDRKLGDVAVDENGNYDFSNDATWGDAIWQGEANSIIENYSEMFGAHLDPVVTFGNMSKLANVVGAKRLGAVLSKADAGALGGVMGTAQGLFNKMGVSDYFGEVTEEYYGQLWRTMLNLDDAYMPAVDENGNPIYKTDDKGDLILDENGQPIQERTNLFASGRFHGDIWGGMALSMGLMGAGKHTISAAQYASMKHGVNKADAAANELFGAEMWEPLKETLDLTTNENIGEVADLIAGDKDMTNEEKAAALNYMERSLYMRGFNLGTMAKARSEEQSGEEQVINESFLDGYNTTTPQEMNDAKNLYEYHRQIVSDLADDRLLKLIDENPLDALDWTLVNTEWNNDERDQVIDYINARQVYQGMIQRVRDDIDGKIDQSNAMIAARANRTTGMIQGATMKQDDRKVYVISGNLIAYPDGTGIDISASDGSIIVRDPETGALEQVSPEALLSIDEAQDPYEQQQLAADAIRVQFAQDAVGKIDGVVSFNPGDTYTIAGADGNQAQVQVAANEMGIVDNGDGTVNVTDGVNVFPLAKEIIQQSSDAANIARVAEFEQQRAIENLARTQVEEEATRPQYEREKPISLRDDEGNIVRGSIEDINEDGVLVAVEDASNGLWKPTLFSREDLDNRVVEYDGQRANQAASSMKKSEEEEDPQPIGSGVFGNIYNQFKGNANKAIDFLLRKKSGEVVGALHHDDIGDISLVWGDSRYGLAHIIERHPEVVDNLQGSIGAMHVASVSENRVVLESGTHKAVVSKMLGQEKTPQWLLTAYEKKSASGGSSDIVPEPVTGKQNGTAPLQDPVSEGEDTTNVPVEQEIDSVSALSRIPQDEQGNPIYEQAETPDLAWDAIVEQTEGDEVMAQTVADGMVTDMEAALKKIEKSKSKGGTTIAEKIAAEKERNAAIEDAKGTLAIWKSIAQTAQRRKSAAEAERRRIIEEQAALRRAEEEKLRAEQEEAARIEREALNGVPDMADDTPQDARARGYRRLAGHKIDRQQPIQHLQGKEVEVKFSDETLANGRVAVIDAAELQPSHIQGMRNPVHFIDEAQPKDRNDEVSVMSARKISGNIRPEEITTSVTAYTGAPTVNARGEVIQGNNRSAALRMMWESEKEQAAIYKQYLKDHAEEFGLNAEDIDAMQSPVLVNMVDVEDADAITLGQFVAQDTESGGIERIKPKNAVQKMGAEMRSFANLLLRSADEETSFAGLVDANGTEVLRWMNQRGYITPTQYKSAFDSKGAITAEAKNDLKGIMYQSIFQGGNTRLEEMFNAMPSKAQRAILATAFRDYDSPNAERMVEEIQNSIRAYYALSHDATFASAKNWKEARMAVEGWKRQYAMDDVTGESYLPADKFSNFALHLATMYKGESQGLIQNTFNHLMTLSKARRKRPCLRSRTTLRARLHRQFLKH